MKKESSIQLRNLCILFFACFAFTMMSVCAVPSAPQTADLVELKVTKIEFQKSDGDWVTFADRPSEFNFLSGETSLIRQILATEDVHPGSYVAVRVTFLRNYGIQWHMFDANNLIFYFTN